MGTHQPNILNHFTRTEDMGRRGRVNGQQAVGSEPTGAGAPAPAHGHVANPDASVPAEGAVPTEEQKARIARKKNCIARPSARPSNLQEDEQEPLPLPLHRQQQALSGRCRELLLVWVRAWLRKGTRSRGARQAAASTSPAAPAPVPLPALLSLCQSSPPPPSTGVHYLDSGTCSASALLHTYIHIHIHMLYIHTGQEEYRAHHQDVPEMGQQSRPERERQRKSALFRCARP